MPCCFSTTLYGSQWSTPQMWVDIPKKAVWIGCIRMFTHQHLLQPTDNKNNSIMTSLWKVTEVRMFTVRLKKAPYPFVFIFRLWDVSSRQQNLLYCKACRIIPVLFSRPSLHFLIPLKQFCKYTHPGTCLCLSPDSFPSLCLHFSRGAKTNTN